MIVAAGIRYLADSSYKNIITLCGFNKSTFYYTRDKFFYALLYTESLKIQPPTTAKEWGKIQKRFAEKSICSLFLILNKFIY